MTRFRSHVAALVLLAGATAGAAQTGAPVRLRVQPRVGDTLHTRFEQDVEMSGATKLHGRDTVITSRSSLLVLARVVVERSDSSGCTLVAITDSVATLSVEQQALAPGESARRAMQGQRITIRLRADGSAAIDRVAQRVDPEVGALVGAMPAVLPAAAVAVGGTWESAMAVPVGERADSAHGARLVVRYRLDSLVMRGARAFISLRGRVDRDSADAPVRDGARLASAGEIAGALTLDRTRGWWTDWRLVIVLRSTVTPAPTSSAPPVHVQTRITQRMHTDDPRPTAGAAH